MTIKKIRGSFRAYGAHTGRVTSSGVQFQNLPRNSLPDIDLARAVVLARDLKRLKVFYRSVGDVLSQLVRLAIVSDKGHLLVSDFSSIEAMVLSALAGQQSNLDIFKSGVDFYAATGERMFDRPQGSISKDDPLRSRAKIAVLALGYQGALGALTTMGGKTMGLSDDEMYELVRRYRSSNPEIVKFWADLEAAAFTAIRTGDEVPVGKFIKVLVRHDLLSVRLPSGRAINYVKPRIMIDEEKEREVISFEGVSQQDRKWRRLTTYGGRLAENVTQGVARDVLFDSVVRIQEAGFEVVATIHDEVIVDDADPARLDELIELMSQPVPWLPGCPLKASGYTCQSYRKE